MSIRPPGAPPSSPPLEPSARVPGELVSALMDGQLRGPLFAQTVHDSTRDPQSIKRWGEYHLIGEAMRSPDVDGVRLTASSPEFLVRLRRRLAEEKLPQAPASTLAPKAVATSFREALSRFETAAKSWAVQPVFFWRAVSAVASAAAFSAVAWHLLLPATDGPQWAQSAPQQSHAALLAQANPPLTPLPGLAVVESPRGPMLRDSQLQALLAAHKQAAGNSALPVPAGFLRNATFEVKASAP